MILHFWWVTKAIPCFLSQILLCLWCCYPESSSYLCLWVVPGSIQVAVLMCVLIPGRGAGVQRAGDWSAVAERPARAFHQTTGHLTRLPTLSSSNPTSLPPDLTQQWSSVNLSCLLQRISKTLYHAIARFKLETGCGICLILWWMDELMVAPPPPLIVDTSNSFLQPWPGFTDYRCCWWSQVGFTTLTITKAFCTYIFVVDRRDVRYASVRYDWPKMLRVDTITV